MKYLFAILLCSICFCGCAQNDTSTTGKAKDPGQLVGGSCEGCEAIHESPVPHKQLSWQDTLPDFNDPGPKLIVSGTVYKNDGVTPAPDIVLYVYHTDQKGLYPTKGNEKGWGKRHGYLRSWVKTNTKGQYRFYTLRPASYPDGNNPQHIHATIKEPGINEYWIDEFEFTDDPYLTKDMQSRAQNRGGSGLVTPKKINGLQHAERDIVLGKNIPGYR